MAIQLTGMASGLDTEAMIQDLVKASSSKKIKLEGEQKKAQWKQDAWTDLNKEIYEFYTKQIEPMKWESAYLSKKTDVADSSIASVVSSDGAVDGTQTLAVKNLAKTGYLTGAQLSGVKTSSTLSSLGILSDGETGSITINGKSIKLDSSTTISSLVTQMNNAGVSASFDEKNQRFFIAAKSSGKENDFTINADNANGLTALSKLGLMNAELKDDPTYKRYANMTAEERVQEIEARSKALAEKYYNSTLALTKANEELATKKAEQETKRDEYASDEKYVAALAYTGKDNAEDALTAIDEKIEALKADLEAAGDDEDLKAAAKSSLDEANDYKAALKKMADYNTAISNTETTINANNDTITENDKYYVLTPTPDAEGNMVDVPGVTSDATDAATAAVDAQIDAAKKAIAAASALGSSPTGAVRIGGENATILLNGAEFTSSSNTFSINGLTITAKGLSEKNEDGSYRTTELTTSADVDAVYDKIVDFFDKYNELLTKFSKLYSAESARKYNMLTKEQKEDMTDDEVKDWEDKIKSALLRRDENLDNLTNIFTNVMAKSYTVNGKSYTLSDFGIETLGYFNAAANEKGNLHINGNEKDNDTKDAKDQLKAALASDPRAVSGFFSQLISNFYDKMYDVAKSSSLKSRNTFYNDKLLKSSYDEYKTKIDAQQKYLDNMESRYRKQFTAMEKALTKTNSQTSYLSGLFGN